MQSAQESKQELEAAIRYAENAISSAKTTIESMEFRQEMAKKQYAEQTGSEEALAKQVQELEERNDELNIQIVEQTNREATLEREVAELRDIIDRMSDDATGDSVTIKQLQNQVDELKSEGARLAERYDEMKEAAFAEGKTIEHLKDKVQGQYDDIVMLEREVEVYTQKYNELAKQKDDLESQVNALEQPERATMPVIPKAVAIAIFREGVAHGVSSACDELDNDAGITIEETEYAGDFEVSFSRWIDLSEHLDLDWMRSKVGDYDEASVVEALGNLCADNEFECRIHGVDDQEEKKND